MRFQFKPFMIAATLALLANGSTVFAADAKTTTTKSKDKAVAKDTYKDQACPEPPKLMTGWYLGAQLGYDSYRVRQQYDTPSTSGLEGSPTLSMTGWVGGLTLGYGDYLSDWFYLGGEVFGNVSAAQFNSTISDGTVAYNDDLDVTGSFGLAMVPGAKLTDQAMGYLRLGWIWANMKASESITGGMSTNRTNTSNGFLMGIGIEALISGNWSVKTEYNHTFLSSFNTSFDSKYTPSDNQFVVGINYHFDK